MAESKALQPITEEPKPEQPSLKDREDLLDTKEGKELKRQVLEKNPGANEHFVDHAVRLCLAGLLPDVKKLERDRNKPKTGAEKRQLARSAGMETIDSKQVVHPKPWRLEDMPPSELKLISQEFPGTASSSTTIEEVVEA